MNRLMVEYFEIKRTNNRKCYIIEMDSIIFFENSKYLKLNTYGILFINLLKLSPFPPSQLYSNFWALKITLLLNKKLMDIKWLNL